MDQPPRDRPGGIICQRVTAPLGISPHRRCPAGRAFAALSAMNKGLRSGFTLVELMIVVAIIGLLAAIALPNFQRVRANAQNGAYISDLRVAESAFMEYAIVNGDYPQDLTPSRMPDGMESYLARMRWTEKNSLGGLWDWDHDVFGITAGVSVYSPKASQKQLQRLDELIDDGNLASGRFKQRPSGYISIIQE